MRWRKTVMIASSISVIYISIIECFIIQKIKHERNIYFQVCNHLTDCSSKPITHHKPIFPINEKKSHDSEVACTSTIHQNDIKLASNQSLKRRSFISKSILLSSLSNTNANAVQGAAEYDLEYYLRDILTGNKKEGAITASKPPKLPPPRTLNINLVSLILNDQYTTSCVVIQSLNDYAPVGTIQDKIEMYRSKSKAAFQSKLNWTREDVTDQYYFDFLCYATWRAAADIIPNYANRQKFVKNIGLGIWKEMQKDYRSKKDDGILSTSATSKLAHVLTRFQTANFIQEYAFSTDSSPKSSNITFDVYDDKDFNDGTTLNFLISIISPPTLYSSLQITGEGSRFAPEFVGTTITAALEDGGLIKAQYETYFVDREYRPNPKDYFPDEQLLQFTIVKNG